MRPDYSLLAKEHKDPDNLGEGSYDVLLSGYNSSERVLHCFSKIEAAQKLWLVHPEYDYTDDDLPTDATHWRGTAGASAIEFWLDLFEHKLADVARDARLCVDITGLMRPHIVVLPLALRLIGFHTVTIIYSDPNAYASGIDTSFAIGSVDRVAQIVGFEGVHGTAAEPYDALVVGAGYDDALIRAVADYKRAAEHFILLGLPSLQPHMYQESQVRLDLARETIHNYREDAFLYSPASDPFVTAQILSDHAHSLRLHRPGANLYLAPVGPKPHVLGFSLFFLCEERSMPTSVIFPFAPRYERETTKGISRVHFYEVELDWIPEL